MDADGGAVCVGRRLCCQHGASAAFGLNTF